MFLRGLPAVSPDAGGGPSPGDGSGWTAGSVIFASATGTLTQDNANLFWDDTTNRLGIGTTGPTTGIEVNGTSDAAASLRILNTSTSADIRFGVYGAGLGFLGMVTNASMEVRTNNTARATWSGAGNLALTPGVSTSGAVTAFKLTAPANTTQTLSTEAIDFHVDLSRTNQWATGALALQRMMLFDVNATLGFVGASTASVVVGVHITAPPTQGTNATFTEVIDVLIGADASAATATTTIASAAGAKYAKLQLSPDTVSFTGNTQLTQGSAVSNLVVNPPAISFAGVVDAAATVYITGAPTISGGGSITNANALFVTSGKTQVQEIEIDGALNHDGTTVGFYGTAPQTKQTVSGAKGGNAALGSLMTALSTIGLVTDSTTA